MSYLSQGTPAVYTGCVIIHCRAQDTTVITTIFSPACLHGGVPHPEAGLLHAVGPAARVTWSLQFSGSIQHSTAAQLC